MRNLFALAAIICSNLSLASIYNLKIVTDANPDYTDLPSLVHSATSNFKTPEEKCWAMFYWNHIARRQAAPIELHGMALTDPIRQFNDYGYTMCSTISGINQSIWEQMGLKHRYWDISNHTVSEVFYDGRWHMYDNSLSALYTLCDGKTIASVEDIGKEGACEASNWKKEPGHIAKYHCLTATSPNGFLTGADTARSLDEEYRCFNPNGLKLRTYFYDWDNGHRYIQNLHWGEVYTRHYQSLGNSPEHFVPNHGKDPEKPNERYRLRGNGVWTMDIWGGCVVDQWYDVLHSAKNFGLSSFDGPWPNNVNKPGEVVFKVNPGNVITSLQIRAAFVKKPKQDVSILISTDNGLHWRQIWKADDEPNPKADIKLIDEVNGSYETLVKLLMHANGDEHHWGLAQIQMTATTNLNSKTQPRLNLGKNAVYVGAGDQTDSIVLWPELQADKYKQLVVEEKNIASKKQHPGYQGTVYPAKAKEDAWLVYRIDAPNDITKLTFGGRFYNRAPKSRIEMLYSLDGGKNWKSSWSLTDTAQPWDVIHYETVDIPKDQRSILIKYVMNTTDPSPSGCGIYALRMEAYHLPFLAAKPYAQHRKLEVTFKWSEVQKDRSLVQREHTQLVEKIPFKYTINVGGEDHPVMKELTVNIAGEPSPNPKGPRDPLTYGYSDGKDAGGQKFIPTWQTLGKNLAIGKKYTLSHPSRTSWDAGDPDGTKLTDGVVGPTYVGGISYRYGALWEPKTNPAIVLDLGEKKTCASFGLNFHGYAWWDSLKGEIKDRVAIQISDDGKNFTSIGRLNTDLHRKDIPVNFMLPDDETLAGHTFRFIPDKPVSTRYVRYLINSDRNFCATELEVLDSIELKPFDLRIALPDEHP